MPADPHVVHRSPDRRPPITVYAKWRATDTLPRKDRSHPIAKNTVAHLYDVPICPDEPLRVGLYVKLRALAPQAYRPPYLPMEAPRFDTYDPHVEGRIVGVSLIEEHTAEFVVRNECWWNPVAYAYIAVQYLPGLTVKLQVWEADRHWEPHGGLRSTRAVPLLDGAEITAFPGEDVGGYPAQFDYPDPVSDATPWLHVWSLERSKAGSTGTVLKPAMWSP